MDVVVVGKHTEVAPALRALTVERVERITKFASDVRRVDVDYEQHPTRRAEDSHSCEILVHVRQHLVKGTASATEHEIALDRALDKVEEQMRRLHGRRVGRWNGSKARGTRAAANGATEADDGELIGADADGVEASNGDGSDRVVVKSKQFDVKPMGIEEAALQMELLGHDFFLFTFADSGRAAVVYRRHDGQLGLIEASG
jgi:ribosomal subunit interface protein